MYRTALAVTRGATLAAITILAAIVPPAYAQTQDGGVPGEWLARYTTARTMGLGGAFVAAADDPLGVLWNPAGLSAMDQNEVRVEYAHLFEDTAVNGVGFAVPGSHLPSLSVLVLSQRSGEFQRTNDMNDNLGTFRNGETAYVLTGSKAFSPRFALGANVKFVQQTVEDFSAGGLGLDVGATYEASQTVKVGASIGNVGGPNHSLRDVEEKYPLIVRAGFAYYAFQGRALFVGQIDQASGMGTGFHAGGEYWIQTAIALRAGYDQSAMGGGFSYRFHPQYQFDYGVSNQDLGLTHRVGLSYRFGGFFASSDAQPPVFSPTGEKSVTRFSLNARTKADAQKWSLELLNKSDEVVRRFGGQGQPPSHIEWDGKDETGMPLADGFYRYSLVVHDAVGREVRSPERTVEILTSGPQGQVPVLRVN